MTQEINRERQRRRQRQAKAVMPMIGPLLDAWDDLPNDVKDDPELEHLATHINLINDAMEAT